MIIILALCSVCLLHDLCKAVNYIVLNEQYFTNYMPWKIILKKLNYADTAFIVIFLCESTAIPDVLL